MPDCRVDSYKRKEPFGAAKQKKGMQSAFFGLGDSRQGLHAVPGNCERSEARGRARGGRGGAKPQPEKSPQGLRVKTP